ncbi:MAG: phosphate acyltransferase PlsX [Candidatus Melainabacteria bacterium HGW-Melainabacteria-1]|nr:MAG: phosphate acyltransferase PlsX [Candidatus Melainabacteria bacterium HGW-Melainabacteria-1]
MEHPVIALDVMGGDFAPSAPIQGALKALARHQDLRLMLVGPRTAIAEALAPTSLEAFGSRLSWVEASQAIGMDEAPVQAIRRKPDASLNVGVNQLVQGKAAAFVTAGNSGAALVAAMRQLGLLPGVSRPALAVLFPGVSGETVLLDVGSQVQCRPEHLLQFARLGTAFARHTLGVPSPRVGLLNVGEEPGKGHAMARESGRRLALSGLNFVGNIEGWDLPRNRVDVAVCDGFTGNIVLKLAEGLSEMLMTICPSLAELPGSRRFEYVEQGGSVVLGLKGLVILSHGRAQAPAIANAIGLAHRSLMSRTLEQMQAEFDASPIHSDQSNAR